MNYNPLIINLYGAPGSGKSTGGAYIYSQLKMKGVNVRLFWGEEIEAESVLSESVRIYSCGFVERSLDSISKNYCPDVIITTMPIGQSAMHNIESIDSFYDIITNPTDRNYLLLRVKPYLGDGRNHTEEESDEIARSLRIYLDSLDLKYSAVGGHKEGYDCIIEDIMNKLEERKRD